MAKVAEGAPKKRGRKKKEIVDREHIIDHAPVDELRAMKLETMDDYVLYNRKARL